MLWDSQITIKMFRTKKNDISIRSGFQYLADCWEINMNAKNIKEIIEISRTLKMVNVKR